MSPCVSRPRLLALLTLALLVGCSESSLTGPELDASPATAGPATGPALSTSPPGFIRIGVVPSATTVQIGGTEGFVVRDKASGAALLSGSAEEVEVSLGEGATSETHYRLQVACASEASRDALVAQAQAQGVVTYVEDAGPCWRVMLGEFDPPPANTFAARVAFKNDMIALGLAQSDAFWKLVTVVEGSTTYRVRRGGEVVTTSGPVVVEPTSGRVLIGGASYRGVGEVALNSSGALAGINELPIEEYLYGVVPRELPPVPYGEAEAQKAQAVAARTYALSGLGKRRADGYDLLPTTSDQVYGGFAAEHPTSSRAVVETAGVVATYGGALVQTLFFSTSGGATANNEDVYNSDPIPYLRGVVDGDQAGDGRVLVDELRDELKSRPTRNDLRNRDESAFESDWSRYHRWTFEWTPDEISRVVSAFAGQPVGRVRAVRVVERSGSGRAKRIEYVTDAGTFTDTKDRIRSSLRYVDAGGALRPLLSTLFVIEPVGGGEAPGFVAYGGGWGHGVGLCQTGAVGMAVAGYRYDEILKRYYQGIDLETRSYGDLPS